MSRHPIHRLDDDVHQRVRLGILASLTGVSRADFTFLRSELGLTDGNLGRHLEVLERAGLVTLTRDSGKGRPRTWVMITRSGRRALHEEVEALRAILADIGLDDVADAEEPTQV